MTAFAWFAGTLLTILRNTGALLLISVIALLTSLLSSNIFLDRIGLNGATLSQITAMCIFSHYQCSPFGGAPKKRKPTRYVTLTKPSSYSGDLDRKAISSKSSYGQLCKDSSVNTIQPVLDSIHYRFLLDHLWHIAPGRQGEVTII